MPQKLETLRTFFLISGIVNIAVLFGWGITVPLTGIATCGCGCLLGFLPILNIISCIFDFISYNRLTNLDTPGTEGTLRTAAIFEIITFATGNIVSMIFGIISVIYINEPEVRDYLIEKKIY